MQTFRGLGRTIPILLLYWFVGAGAPPAAVAQRGQGNLWLEIGGGTVGALAGFGLGVLVTDSEEECSDDLESILEDLGVTLVSATAGAAAGSFLAGRLSGGHPSILGGVLGAAVGTAAGLGVAKLLEEGGGGVPVQVVGLSISGGTLSAFGARLLGG